MASVKIITSLAKTLLVLTYLKLSHLADRFLLAKFEYMFLSTQTLCAEMRARLQSKPI